jgi:hypothetical protein
MGDCCSVFTGSVPLLREPQPDWRLGSSVTATILHQLICANDHRLCVNSSILRLRTFACYTDWTIFFLSWSLLLIALARRNLVGTHSLIGTATGYGMDDQGGRSSSPGRVKNFLFHFFQTGSGVHPTSYTMGTGGSFPRVKRPEREADHSPPASVEVNKMWIYTTTPPYVLLA